SSSPSPQMCLADNNSLEYIATLSKTSALLDKSFSLSRVSNVQSSQGERARDRKPIVKHRSGLPEPKENLDTLIALENHDKTSAHFKINNMDVLLCECVYKETPAQSRLPARCRTRHMWKDGPPLRADINPCSSNPCLNGGTCVEGGSRQYKCTCPQEWTGSNCQYQTQTAPPESTAISEAAFNRKPRCARIDRTQHCSCDAGFQMSGTPDNSICQDVNECEVYKMDGAPRLCMHTCVNTPGTYRCSCPSGYKIHGDGKTCEDIDECTSGIHNCTRGAMCINTGGSFQCVFPECPKSNGNISYVKTSPIQCERNPCPMESRSCHHAPKTISFHYLALPSNLPSPVTLFRMATASAPGRPGPDSLRFGIVGGNSRGNFVMQRSDRQTGELILVQSLQGPQTIEVDVDMSEYLDRTFQAKHVSKITVFVSPYNF
ncbi:fibulin-7, partial [Pelobates cultripes]